MRRCLAVVATAAALLSGCASAPLAPPHEAGSPTDGLGLELWFARIPTVQYQYFVVKADGTLEFGGGMAALNRQTEWKGKLTAEEGKTVRTLIDEAGWLTAESPNKKDGETPLAEIALMADGKSREVTISGANPQVQAVVDALQQVANQRLERYMRRLPDAGLQRK